MPSRTLYHKGQRAHTVNIAKSILSSLLPSRLELRSYVPVDHPAVVSSRIEADVDRHS